ncbi:hypothetical protein [Sphingomonas jaspsi]|uniref:hypothetical protein n=1 Tax=Sphingomonas jaspsi TaxID=392409 RepID=UPI0004B8418E|nr:hypothetical protein [Sphingomonas jaspsi]
MSTEPTYSVFHHEPYEGQSVVFSGTREEMKDWFLKDRGRYSLDDLEIYNNDAPDVFAFWQEIQDE